MKKLLALILACLLFSASAFAAFGSGTKWDVQTTGLDTNGGAFDSGVGSPGTNESMGAGTAITITLTGTTTGTGSPVFSSTTHGPGNFVHIASGAGCTTGWYEILSQSAGGATFDHAMGSNTNVCVGTIGGSLLTTSQATALCVTGGNAVYVQTGTYTRTATLDLANCSKLIGYQTTHGDIDAEAWTTTNWATTSAKFPLITTATNSTNLIKLSVNQTYTLQNLSLSNTAGTRAEGVFATLHTPKILLESVILDGFTKAVDCDNITNWDCTSQLANVEAKNNTFYVLGWNQFPAVITHSNIHDNPTTGSSTFCSIGGSGTYLELDRSLVTNNTGGSNEGICLGAGASLYMRDSTYANNAGPITSSATGDFSILNVIAYGNTPVAAAIDCLSTTGILALISIAYGANSVNTVNCGGTGVAAITLSADPFTNDSGSNRNYSLNSAAGGGALLKALGIPHIFPGGATTGYPDVGPAQSQASGALSATPYGYVR